MEFDRLVAYFDADVSPLIRKGKQAHKVVDDLEARFKKLKLQFGSSATSGRGGVDAEMRRAQTEIGRMQAARTRAEREYTRSVEREARTQSRVREREYKRSMNQMITDSKKRDREIQRSSQRASRTSSLGGFSGRNALLAGIGGGAALGAVVGIGGGLASIATQGREAYASLDKLVRFTATLDRAFQSPPALAKFKADIEALSLVVPQSAENIADASFTIKSAYQNMKEPELIAFLKNMSIAATASNTTVDQHAKRVAALASGYAYTTQQLNEFNAILSTSFGAALAPDSEVGAGFQSLITPAQVAGQSLNELAAAMGAIQSSSADAQQNTMRLKNVLVKFIDPKFAEKLQETFKISLWDQAGKFKGLNKIVNEVAKSLVGLTDKQKALKIGSVFTDQRDAAGMMSLIAKLDTYNGLLREGSDADQWAAKQTTTLNSADARWQLFTNRVEDFKRKIGQSISEAISSPAEAETGGGQATLALAELVKNVDLGALGGAQAFVTAAQNTVGAGIAKAGLISPAQLEEAKAKVRKDFDELRATIAQDVQSNRVQVAAGELIHFQSVAQDPKASADIKHSAEESVARLREGLKRSFSEMEPVQIERLKLFYGPEVWAQITKDIEDPLLTAYKNAFKSAGEGLASGDASLVKAAAQSIEKLKLEIIGQLNRGDISPEVRSAFVQMFKALPDIAPGVAETGQPLGEALGAGVVTGIEQKKGDITTAATAAMEGDQNAARAKGEPLGMNFAEGVAMGIRNNFGPVGSAVAWLIDKAFGAGQKEEIAKSPSKRAADELGLPFVQGIEVGILAREASLTKAVSGLISRAMFSGPKGKKKKSKTKPDEAIRELLADLGLDASRIDAEASRSTAAARRFYDALLGDQTADFDTQAGRVDEFYTKIYDAEESAYQRRLANIASREDAIKKLKKIKETERARELQKLGDERADVDADREQSRFENQRDRAAGIAEAGQRQIEQMQRAMARDLRLGDINRVGGPGTAEDEAARASEQRILLIDSEIQHQQELRYSVEAGSAARVTIENKLKDLFEDRKDAEVEGAAEIKAARDEDLQSLQEYYRAVADFAGQTKDAEFEASQARIDLLRESGAKEREIFQAEMALEIERENFRHQQRQLEITALAQDLVNRAQNREQILEIERTFNAQMEAEMQRHGDVLKTISASQGEQSILGQWKLIADRLPTYQDQLKSFAVGLPETLTGVFSQALEQFDGTWNGFLNSLKTAFFRAIQEMLAELFRSNLIKLLVQLGTSLAGAFGGGIGGGGTSTGLSGAGNPGGIASGGYASGGVPPVGRASIVGEEGPEIFVPRTAGRILSNEESKEALSGRGRGGDTFNTVINQNFKGPRGLVPPKSVKQQTEAALAGVAYGSKGRRG